MHMRCMPIVKTALMETRISPMVCNRCWGKKQVEITGDKDARKFALEMGGLIGKGSGVKVQINTQVNSGLPPAFEDITRRAIAPVITVEATTSMDRRFKSIGEAPIVQSQDS